MNPEELEWLVEEYEHEPGDVLCHLYNREVWPDRLPIQPGPQAIAVLRAIVQLLGLPEGATLEDVLGRVVAHRRVYDAAWEARSGGEGDDG